MHILEINCLHCNAPKILTDTYYQGTCTSCEACEKSFTQIVCPFCHTSCFWSAIGGGYRFSLSCFQCMFNVLNSLERSGVSITCITCKRGFVQVNCPVCQVCNISTEKRALTADENLTCVACNASFTHNTVETLAKVGKDLSATCMKEDCRRFVESLNWPSILFDPQHDGCFCNECCG
jgi:hypothetical protein